MAAPGLVAVATVRQWEHCRRDGVVVDAVEGVVELAWQVEPPPASGPHPPRGGRAGLAVDRACFVYHGVPDEGRVERVRWSASGVTRPADVLVPPSPPVVGPFVAAGRPSGGVEAVALAVDDQSRLYVVDDVDGAVAVYDLADRRLLQRVRLPGRALDVATVGTAALVLCDDPDQPLWRVAARREPVPDLTALTGLTGLVRIAVAPSGEVWGLTAAGDVIGDRRVGAVPGATDIEVAADGSVVVADASGAEFRRFSVKDVDEPSLRPLVARDYDGRGIVRMPDGTIGFWTNAGRLRRTVAGLLRFAGRGAVTAGPLDAQTYNETWGRVLVDACVPEGTSVWVATGVSDDEDEPPELDAPHRMHCRETGPEMAWAQPATDDPYETLEAPVGSSAGRYLWLRLELRGTKRATPKVRAARAEHPGHDLLRRLPRTYSRDTVAAAFLTRYLGIAAGMLGDIERRADERDVLLDPNAAPAPVLPWLGSLIGLTLDDRWPEPARRTLVREAACLFRKRGTKEALERMLELYLGRRPRIVELFRVRGQYAATLGGGLPRTAHRFSVVIPTLLGAAQEQAVRDLLEAQKPAHTAYELCTVGAGMRVGRGLYVELTSIVGPGSGFEQARVGDSALGRKAVLGRPHDGIRPCASRVGQTTRLER